MKNEQSCFDNPQANRVLENWWAAMDPQGDTRAQARRGDRAQLRRCRSSLDAAACPYFHHLYHQMRHLGAVDGRRLAPAAVVLAHIKKQPEGQKRASFAKLMASPRTGGDQPRVSGLRFRRLLSLDDRDELLPALVRVVRLLDGTAPAAGLARDIYFWGDNVKERWAYDYYATAHLAD